MRNKVPLLAVAAGLIMCGGTRAANDWGNQDMIGQNKESARATAVPYASMENAMKGNRSATKFVQSLDRVWKFNGVKHPKERPQNFYRRDFNRAEWETIPVSSNGQLEGYGFPIYSNQRYPFKKLPPISCATRQWRIRHTNCAIRSVPDF